MTRGDKISIDKAVEETNNQNQKSTKTLFWFIFPWHDKLSRKFSWYDAWHRKKYHRHVHYSALAIVCISITILMILSAARLTYAADGTIPISHTSLATIANTGEKIYFDSVTHGSNVSIDNYSRAMSGYGWSTDLGWINFGSGIDNPSGPVVADKDGKLSGKAKALNAGYIDFNTAPAGSNVVITAGNFAGHAWSEDLGWIDFSGVSAPGYNPDLLPPDNPVVSAESTMGGTALTSGNWYNFQTPYFSWPAPTDYANGITPSGIAGYYVYFGTNGATEPVNYQGGMSFTSPNLGSNFGTYYLRIKTKDVAGNISNPATLFTYKYETAAPTAPTYVSVTPSGYSRANNFTFLWSVTGPSAATDSGGSGLAKYQYKINSEANWHNVAGNANTANITLTDVATTGVNTFDLIAVDTANNVSPAVRTNFYFNDSAPTAPRNLTVTPTSSSTNAFGFSWSAPPGEIGGYYYSINALPTLSNANFTTETSLASGPYATQQDENTFYILAKDNAGNYDFASCSTISGNPAVDGCAKVTFSAVTVAPGILSLIHI